MKYHDQTILIPVCCSPLMSLAWGSGVHMIMRFYDFWLLDLKAIISYHSFGPEIGQNRGNQNIASQFFLGLPWAQTKHTLYFSSSHAIVMHGLFLPVLSDGQGSPMLCCCTNAHAFRIVFLFHVPLLVMLQTWAVEHKCLCWQIVMSRVIGT